MNATITAGRRGRTLSEAGTASFPGKKDSLTLLELVEGETAAIHALHNDGVTKKRIQALGLFEGRRVCVIARAPFSGPLLVEDVVTGARVMIARDLAENIEVAADGAGAD